MVETSWVAAGAWHSAVRGAGAVCLGTGIVTSAAAVAQARA